MKSRLDGLDIGAFGEEQASAFLQKKGYAICEKNYRVKGGELDIIARIGRELVFVEVKTRTSKKYGYPEEGVHFFKMKRILKAIRAYLLQKRVSDALYLRFDIVAIEMSAIDGACSFHHIENVELPETIR